MKSGSDPDFGFAQASARMSSGVVVWALHFAFIYGYTALACARGFGASAPWVVGVASVIAAVLVVLILLRNLGRDFTRWMSAAIAAAALVAIVWEGLTVLLVPVCA